MTERQSPEWLDSQYNNRGRIPEHPQILQEWADRSRAALATARCVRDVRYGQGVPPALAAGHDPGDTLDLFLPEPSRDGPAPVLVYLHGGYWRALSKRDHAFVAPPFAQAGALVVIPDYPLAPAVSIEHIVMQVACALALDWTAYQPDLPARLVKGAVSLSGVFDLEPLRHAPFLAPDLRLDEHAALRLSPAYMPPPHGPLIALVGAQESEEFVRQNRLIRESWGTRTVTVCETVPGRHHMNVLHDLADPKARAHHLTLGLLGLPRPAG